MTPADLTPLDDQVLAELLAEDASLAAGRRLLGASPDPSDTSDVERTVSGAPPDLRECLRILEKVFPRSGTDGSALPAPGAGAPASPWKLGRFEVLQELGRGGFGIVYLAHDPVLGRRVALKVPRPEALLSETLRRRFLREARAAGGLDHPCIVPVFEAGEDGLLCYIASTYCEGPTLAAWMRRRGEPVPMRLAARLVSQMSDAVQHAHDRGILHCDIKPSNVLLQQGPDQLDPADLVPRLTDFGLARLAAGPEPGVEVTRSGVPVGSPPYMAPEQAAGRNRDLGRGTDVYALGATLYELLTGRPAFRGETMTETLRMVLDTDPVSPRTLRPGLSRDLETVCLSCLEKDPAKRYPSASALAEDLNRFLSGEPIFARPAGPVERGLKSIRRHPAAAAMFALAVALIVCLGGVTAWSNALLRSHNVALQREADRADMNARLAQRLLYADRLRLARQALDLDQLERTQEILGDIRPETEGSEPRGFVWGHLWRQARREVVLLGDDVRWCDRFTISADGRSLASYDLKGRVVIWDLVAQNKRSVVETLAPIEPSVSLSPDGRLLAAVEQFDPLSKLPRRGRVWETSSAKLRAELPAPKGERLESLTILTGERVLMTTTRPGSAGLTARIYEPTCGPGPPRVLATVAEGASFVNPSPDGTRLAVYRDGRLDVVDASTGAAPVEIHDGTCAEPVTHAEFARDARTLLTFAGRRATFWDTVTGRPRASHDLVEPPVLYTLSQDGTTLAVLTPGGVVTLWNRDRGHVAEVESDDLKREAEIHLALSADGTRLALSSNGQTTRAAVVTLWDATDGHWLQNFPGRRDDVHFLSFLPGGRSLLVGGGDWPRVWRFDRPGEIAPAIEHSDEAWAVTFSPDGLTLATGSDDTDEPTTLKLWDAAKGTFRKGWKAHPATVSAIAFHPGGRLLATAGFHPMENLRLWDPRDGRLLAKMYGHTDRVRSVVFSPDGTKLATASNDHTVRIWDVASHKPLAVLTGHTDTVRNVVFAPDGRTLASAANDRTVRTWDVASKKQLKLFGGTGKFSAVAYTIDGATLVAANEDGVISLWNPTTGEARAPIRSDDAELRCLAVSPDGRTIAAAGASKSVHIWDLLSGQQLITLPPHRQIVNSIGFSPDGRTLASASHDGMIHVWRADTPPPP